MVMDIAPVTYSVTDGTNWQDTHEVGRGGREGGGLSFERIAGLVVMGIAPLTYSVTDGTN